MQKKFKRIVLIIVQSHYLFPLRRVFIFIEALKNIRGILQSRESWKTITAKLADIRSSEGKRVAFTVFGLDSVPSDLKLYQLLSVISFHANNQKVPIYLFYSTKTNSVYWKILECQTYVNLIQIPSFSHYRFCHFKHYAHKSDILRLIILDNLGGVYFDIDTITTRDVSFELNSNLPVLGYEYIPKTNKQRGICNAVLFAPTNSKFISEWIDKYRYFYSKGRDSFWGELSIVTPLRLAKKKKLLKSIKIDAELFAISWLDLDEILFSSCDTKSVIDSELPSIIHLWESLTAAYLDQITVEYIWESSSRYALLARESLERIGLNLLLD